MKNIFLAFAVTLTSSLAFTNKIAAQDFIEINEEDMRILYSPLVINHPAISTTGNDLKNINERAVKNFHKNYPSVTNEEWTVTTNHGYLVMFNAGGAQTIVGYNRNGSLHHTINYYGEEKLPREIRFIVKSVYYDYSITRVAEVNINEPYTQTTYVVYIRDGNGSKKLIISNNEILSEQETLNGLKR